MKNKLLTLAVATATAVAAPAAFADTLDDVIERGYVQCGVTLGVPGFSMPDENNNWSGLEVDYCRALAAAIFDDPDAVRYTGLTSQARFESLGNGNVDVLSRTTTWTMTRDTDLGLTFVGTMFYDGQGFLVKAADGISSALELSGAAVCIEAGTTTELNAADYFAANGMDLSNAVIFVTRDEVTQAYLDGRCDVYTTDASAIAAERTQFPDPSAHVILPEIISKEPLGPVVRSGDTRWFNITRWTYFALLNAEELGVTQANVDEMLGSDNPEIKRLLGVEGDFGSPIGLSADWAYRIIKHIGNYGEAYDRHVGPNTPLGIPRGINALWSQGGIQYAPPIR
ncbi:amino acid ABC transporter substrate-binding protein [Pelagibacterium limicola]|uniref:amino acid ABC transporter substrate-binding protein n=1 Tax=Pelagibacterium limicola TaxID=2791022 RepID=UPI0018AF7662|nr:amino acid ABC transporter substrate-binding protein [Pelagibacterium limicola]